jgi:hypothetical protein
MARGSAAYRCYCGTDGPLKKRKTFRGCPVAKIGDKTIRNPEIIHNSNRNIITG